MWYQPFYTIHDCILQAKRVDVWQFPLHHLPSWAYPILSQDEQARANRYHFPKHQRRFTAARAMLRIILAKYLKQDPSAITFTHNQYGKPFLIQNTTNLQFNLSHSKECALLAIGQQDELGIDLEYFSKRPYLGIANHVFSDTEIEALMAQPSESHALTFFTIWAQKEAFIKATGLGLAYPLKQLNVSTLPNQDYEIIDSMTQTTWRLMSWMLKNTCSAALCVSPHITQIRRMKLETLEDMNHV